MNLDHDQAARQRAVTLEATGKLPPGFVSQHYPLTRAEQRELKRLKTAGLLATDVDTYVALARERKMPQGWLQRRLRELGAR